MEEGKEVLEWGSEKEIRLESLVSYNEKLWFCFYGNGVLLKKNN